LLGPARGLAFGKAGLPYRLGIYEIHVQRALAGVLMEGAVFYDVGANLGFYSLLGAKLVGDTGIVIAFEPSTDSCRELRAICNSNGVRNVQLITEAVSATAGDAYFSMGSSHAQHHLAEHPAAGSVKVRTVSLDQFTETHPMPHVILMDIEGAESEALRGARRLLSLENAPAWIIEEHDSSNEEQVNGILRESGYTVMTLTPPVARIGRYPIHVVAQKVLSRRIGLID